MATTRRNTRNDSIKMQEKREVATPEKNRQSRTATVTPSVPAILERENISPVRALKLSVSVETPEKSNRIASASKQSRSEKLSPAQSQLVISPRVDKIYKIVQKCTGALGGNGYDGAIYGELTKHSMQKVVNLLMDHCGMTKKSRFIDVGSGLGKPNFHASQSPGVRLSLGIELEEIRWQVRSLISNIHPNRTNLIARQLAIHNLNRVLPEIHETSLPSSRKDADDVDEEVKLNGGLNFMAGDIDNAVTFVSIVQHFFT